MEIRKTTLADIPEIMEIYTIARSFMRKTGNPTQWAGGYPKEELIRKDIASGDSYVAVENGRIEVVFFYRKGEDPTYKVIEDGAWLDDEPYAVLHRIASRGDVKGSGSACIQWCLAQWPNLRVDTHEDNHVMQHVLEKNGFVKCGRIYIADGSSANRISAGQKGEKIMEREELRTLLEKVESGQQTAADALSDISLQPDMLVGNYADIDLHRHMRQGMPEVIYGAGKTAEQIVGIASAMKQKGLKNILITRLSEEKADEIAKALEFSYYSTPQIGIVNEARDRKKGENCCRSGRYE